MCVCACACAGVRARVRVYLHGLGDLVAAAAGLLEADEGAAEQADGGLLGHGAALQADALVVVREHAVVLARQRQQPRLCPLRVQRREDPAHLTIYKSKITLPPTCRNLY